MNDTKANAKPTHVPTGGGRVLHPIDPILQGWESSTEAPPLVAYEPGSWGPAEADSLLARSEHHWRFGRSDHEE